METSSQTTLSIRVPSGPFDFEDMEVRPLAVLGRVWTALAAYEYSCDDFIFAVAEHHPSFVTANRLKPAHNSNEKRQQFILESLAKLGPLRDLHDLEGKPDLDVIRSLMEAIWFDRNQLAHGRLWSSGIRDLGFEFNFSKWSRVKGEHDTFQHTTFTYEQARLEQILESISYLRAMLSDATRLVSGKSK